MAGSGRGGGGREGWVEFVVRTRNALFDEASEKKRMKKKEEEKEEEDKRKEKKRKEKKSEATSRAGREYRE